VIHVVTLEDIFRPIDRKYFRCRRELEEGVLDEFNKHITKLPIGFSYKDAIEGARERGWLHARQPAGVAVCIS